MVHGLIRQRRLTVQSGVVFVGKGGIRTNASVERFVLQCQGCVDDINVVLDTLQVVVDEQIVEWWWTLLVKGVVFRAIPIFDETFACLDVEIRVVSTAFEVLVGTGVDFKAFCHFVFVVGIDPIKELFLVFVGHTMSDPEGFDQGLFAKVGAIHLEVLEGDERPGGVALLPIGSHSIAHREEALANVLLLFKRRHFNGRGHTLKGRHKVVVALVAKKVVRRGRDGDL